MKQQNITYNQAIEEIETIIDQIENDELDVDILTEKVKRVSFLLQLCKTRLRSTEVELEKILKNMDNEESQDKE